MPPSRSEEPTDGRRPCRGLGEAGSAGELEQRAPARAPAQPTKKQPNNTRLTPPPPLPSQYDEFGILLDMLGSRPELEALWAALLVAPNADVKLAYAANMTALAHATASADSVLHTFEDLEKRNRERAPAARFFQFVGTPSPTSPGQQPDTVNFQTLVNWATTADNDLTNPAANSPGAHDMTQPLGHYWISTSHNTYLEGDQVRRRGAVAGSFRPRPPNLTLPPPPSSAPSPPSNATSTTSAPGAGASSSTAGTAWAKTKESRSFTTGTCHYTAPACCYCYYDYSTARDCTALVYQSPLSYYYYYYYSSFSYH